jgi:hypothetical protein
MILAGLDIATVTGIAVLDGERLVWAHAFKWEGSCSGEIFRHFRSTFYRHIEKYGITHVAAEEPLRTDIELKGKPNEDGTEGEKRRPTMQTFQRVYGLCAICEEVCAARKVDFRYVHQGTWRKAFTGNGRATKEESLGWARLVDPSIHSLDAAEALGVAWWLRGQLDPRFSVPRGDLFEPAIQPKGETPF